MRRPLPADRRWALWLAAVLALAASVAADALGMAVFGDTGCELVPGSSTYGDVSWSVVRLGSVCTYRLGSGEHVDAPSALKAAVLLGLAAWAWTLWRVRSRQQLSG